MLLLKPNNIYTVLAFAWIAFTCSAQEQVNLSGVVKDTTTILADANIIAFPDDSNAKVRFTISDEKGYYKLVLDKDIAYTIEVSYLGYTKKRFSFTAQKDTRHDFILLPNPNQLDEVKLTYTIPVIIKEDTTIYDAGTFTNGSERKLRDVLKKLPGIEVNREGDVTFKGKQITEVLVENDKFFTGNSKLAINNIPANAINKIEVLENYNEIGFLKGLQDRENIALNVKLKEKKKNFAFGDVQTNGGLEDRYVLHPTLFYYSPKTTVNVIGDFNNIGESSFSFQDYLDFQGGIGAILEETNGYRRLVNDEFAQFIGNQDFKENINRFGAFNLRNTISKKTKLNLYVIASNTDTQTQENTTNTFIGTNGALEEIRDNTNTISNAFVLGKLGLKHEFSSTANLKVNSNVQFSRNSNNGILVSNSAQQENLFDTEGTIDAVELSQDISYNKRFSKHQTISVEGAANYQNNNLGNIWSSNNVFLDTSIPFENQELFTIAQNRMTNRFDANLVFKDYWVLNNHNHIYTTLGGSYVKEELRTDENILLENRSLLGLSDADFGNDLDYRINDYFAGLEYKFLTGIFTVRLNGVFHSYSLNGTQPGSVVSENRNVILPKVNVKAKLSKIESLGFNFESNIGLPQGNQLLNNFFINSFNSIRIGNPLLSLERFDSYTLNYSKFKLASGLQLSSALSYTRRRESIKTVTELNGIEQLTRFTLFDQPENSLNANLFVNKRIGSLKLSVQGNGNYNESFRLVNGTTALNISQGVNTTLKLGTNFSKTPNVELEYKYAPSVFRTSLTRNRFTNSKYGLALNHRFLKDFQVKFDYSMIQFVNNSEGTQNTFDLANASLFYQKEGSHWGFELKGNNLFNTQFKQRSSFSDFLVSEQTTFVIPRILLASIIFEL